MKLSFWKPSRAETGCCARRRPALGRGPAYLCTGTRHCCTGSTAGRTPPSSGRSSGPLLAAGSSTGTAWGRRVSWVTGLVPEWEGSYITGQGFGGTLTAPRTAINAPCGCESRRAKGNLLASGVYNYRFPILGQGNKGKLGKKFTGRLGGSVG